MPRTWWNRDSAGNRPEEGEEEEEEWEEARRQRREGFKERLSEHVVFSKGMLMAACSRSWWLPKRPTCCSLSNQLSNIAFNEREKTEGKRKGKEKGSETVTVRCSRSSLSSPAV